MSNINNMSNLIIDFFKTCKYFVYFNLFLNVLILNILYYKLTNNINYTFIRWLYNIINLNGCILIKIVQWINSNYEILNIKDGKLIYDIFSPFYEDCNIHNLNYTKKIFFDEFKENFDDIIELDHSYNIKSGSMAQVYKGTYYNKTVAIKVIHPDIKYQLIFPIFYIKLYKFFVKNVSFLKKYDTVFIYDSFFNNLKNQTNMINEFNNMIYFYNTYIDNEYVLIPEPLQATNNILLMEFIDGDKFESLDISIFEKQKIISLLNMFIKDCYFFKHYYHSDLHESNWKVIKYNDFYKLIVYDYGYISQNNFHQTFKDLTYYNDIVDVNSILDILYFHCEDIKFTKEEFKNEFYKYIKEIDLEIREPFSDELTITLYTFIYKKSIIFKPYLFEMFISTILCKKNIIKFLNLKKVGTNNYNLLVSSYLDSIYLCNKYNIFNELAFHYKNVCIHDPNIKKSYVFENTYFDKLVSSQYNSIDI